MVAQHTAAAVVAAPSTINLNRTPYGRLTAALRGGGRPSHQAAHAAITGSLACHTQAEAMPHATSLAGGPAPWHSCQPPVGEAGWVHHHVAGPTETVHPRGGATTTLVELGLNAPTSGVPPRRAESGAYTVARYGNTTNHKPQATVALTNRPGACTVTRHHTASCALVWKSDIHIQVAGSTSAQTSSPSCSLVLSKSTRDMLYVRPYRE